MLSFRYIDDVFMTTNQSHAVMTFQLENARAKDPNIQITYSIGSSVDYLDVKIENQDGKLKTSVFHKPAAEPCILPYASDHPRRIYQNIVNSGLMRAARYSSTVEDFDHERLKFELTLITSGYPLKFIDDHFRRFFRINQAQPVFERLDDKLYDKLHRELLRKASRNEKLTNQHGNDTIDIAHYLPVRKPWDREKLILHYNFENGPLTQYRRELRRLWEKYYAKVYPRLKDVHLIIGSRINRALEYRLVKKKPLRTFLVD